MARSGALIIFTRTPVAGKTKTRLIPELGPGGAVELHIQMLEHTVAIAGKSVFNNVEIHAYPDIKNRVLQKIAKKHGIEIFPQAGVDIGERMFNAISMALSHYDFAVITGSDCPALSTEILDQAFDVLEKQEAQAVLGPSLDGGYYLIGTGKAEPSLFRHIQWGKDDVADKTRSNMTNLGWSWHETDQLWDVDTPADLGKLREYGTLDIPIKDMSGNLHIADSG